MADFVIKQNDTTPSLVATLTPAGEPAEFLVGAEEVFIVVREKGKNDEDGPKFKSLCSIDDAATGKVSYDWEATDTDTAGEFQFEFEVVWPSGVETIPREGYKTLLVEDDLG